MNSCVKKQMHSEQGLAKDSPVQMMIPTLSHQDSLKFNLISQDELLYRKFEEYSKIYQFIEKLSKNDKMLREKFYDENIKFIDDKYRIFYQNKRRNKTQFEKLAINTINFRLPILIKCKDEADTSKCFSTAFRREIEKQYNIQEYIYYDTNIIKAKILFRVTKDGNY